MPLENVFERKIINHGDPRKCLMLGRNYKVEPYTPSKNHNQLSLNPGAIFYTFFP